MNVLAAREQTPFDGLRIFVGGIVVCQFAHWYWFGNVWLPAVQAVAAPMMDSPEIQDGAYGSPVVGTAIAIITGICWAIGSLTITALTLGWNVTKSVTSALLNIVLSMTEGGRQWLAAREFERAQNQTAANQSVNRVVAQGDRHGVEGSNDAGTRTGQPGEAEALAAEIEKRRKVTRVVNKMIVGFKELQARVDELEAKDKKVGEFGKGLELESTK